MTPTRRSEFDYFEVFYYLSILLLPFLLLQINNSWIFHYPVSIDAWIYSGFHLHLREFLTAFGGTYYASRVPWTVPGWLSHLIFSDERALYVLHFGVFYLAAFSLYHAIRNIFANRAAAFTTALVMGTHAYFLVAVGWDYVDGYSIAWLLASLAALSSAAIRRRWRLAAVAWGIAMCLTISTYILLVLFLPIEIGIFLLLNRFAGKRPIVPCSILAVSGGVGATVTLGLINWLLGGPFLYLVGQINPLSTVAANRFRWDLPLAKWVWNSPWLLLPAIAFTFSCVFLWRHKKSVVQKMRSADSTLDWEVSLFICCLADVAASLIFVAMEADHFYVLQIDYRANSLLPFALLAVGGAFAAMCKPLPSIRGIGFLIGMMAIALSPWLLTTFAVPAVRFVFGSGDLIHGLPLTLGWIIGGALLIAFFLERSCGELGAAMVIAFLSIIGIGARPGLRLPDGVSVGYLSFPPDPAFKQETLAVFDASRDVGRYDPDARARFWFDANDPRARDLQDVVSTYLYAYSLVNDGFPNLIAKDGRRASIAPGDRIILLTSTSNPIPLANAAVADQSMVFDEVAEIPIRRPEILFTAFVTDVKIDLSKYDEITLPWAVSGPRVVTGLNPKLQDDFLAEVNTPAHPWAYGARFPLQEPNLEGPLLVRVRAFVQRGPVGIGILNQDGSDFLSRVPVLTSGDATVMLSVPNPRQIGDLVIESWDRGKPGELRVETITVLKPRVPIVERR